ncbi:sulfatase-like hydrolase/transferase [Auraticoccus sp. F435]|uniref:Sulfatase-like hydrolase/transferase n=1 Tax=Auraticoccus cholistanensis TaxID=2656650 RepID=A0A6A9UUH6_9ACTN|nr:sulfatase-like hydrolase/transferase [Auraticoccus cholistanensis]
MERQKLVVISVDAMSGQDDIAYARTLPSFGRILQRAAVAEIEAVFPTVTYPNHTAILTGCAPARSGVWNNVLMQPGISHPDWFWQHDFLQVPTLLEVAKAAGMTTASVQWPVTGGAPYDVVVPEMGNEDHFGGVDACYATHCSPRGHELWLRHRDKIVWQPKRRNDEMATAVTVDLLLEDRPDVLFLHLVDVDAARHLSGAAGEHVHEALRATDERLGRILDALESTGDAERTNIVIVSDHGHLDTVQHTNVNVLLRDRGFLTTDEEHRLVDWEAYCHSSGLSGQVFLADGLAPQRREQLEAVLRELEQDPRYRVERVLTAAEAEAEYGLAGPFDYVVESEPGVIVGGALDRRVVVRKGEDDFRGYLGNHGHAPRHGDQPVFLAAGPAFRAGVDAGRRSMLDEAPTFAAVLGLDLPTAEGSVITEVLTGAGTPQPEPVVGDPEPVA